MKIKNKLNVLLMGGIAISSATYAGKLELIYLQNVIQFIRQKEEEIDAPLQFTNYR